MPPILQVIAGNQSFSDMKILMLDPISASIFTQHVPTTIGDRIKMPEKDKIGQNFYTVKISEEVHLENDPSYPCIDYTRQGEYGKCLEKEYMEKILTMTNCTPPWFTKNEDMWCKGKPEFESEQKKVDFFEFISELLAGQADPGKCLVPCKNTKYFISESGFSGTAPVFVGLGLVFEKVVEKSLSELQIGARTLVTRFGGIIGVGKNLMWLIILLISTIRYLADKTKRKEDERPSDKE